MSTESNSTNPKPTFAELLDYAEGRLTGTEQERVAAFLADNPEDVATEWAWVQDFLKTSQSVELHPLPEGLESQLTRIYTTQPEEAPLEKLSGWLKGIRQVVAELVDHGPAQGLAAAGLRSREFESGPRQWVFKTADFDIMVNALERPDQRFDLHGQVLSVSQEAEGTVQSVQLLRDDHECGLAAVDEYGEFVIQGVQAGEFALVIAGEETEVVCAPIAFGG